MLTTTFWNNTINYLVAFIYICNEITNKFWRKHPSESKRSICFLRNHCSSKWMMKYIFPGNMILKRNSMLQKKIKKSDEMYRYLFFFSNVSGIKPGKRDKECSSSIPSVNDHILLMYFWYWTNLQEDSKEIKEIKEVCKKNFYARLLIGHMVFF